MSARRIALISPYALGVFGGVQEQVLAMSRELTRRDCAVLVLAPGRHVRAIWDTPATVVTCGGVTSVPANGSRSPVTLSLLASRRCAATIETFDPDVVHVHEPFAPVMSYEVLRRHRRPVVATLHRAGAGPAYTYTRPLLRALAARLDAVVSVSEAAAQTALTAVGLTSQVAFNGFETERFREHERTRDAMSQVVFVGRLEERKGVDTLIAATRAAGAQREWRLVIAGDGPMREELRRSSAGLRDVTFLGAVDDATKRKLLRSSDVAVCASKSGESFGLVILEAMAAETRVVVSDIDGYIDAAGGCAVTFSAGDVASLLAAIELARQTSEDTDAARAHAEHWSMANLMNRYVDIYDAAIDRFARRR